MTTTTKIFALFAVLCVAAAAQQKAPSQLPDTGNVSLPLDEYNKLVELASKPPKRPEPPPVNYTIKGADMKLHVENGTVLGTVLLMGETLKKGMSKVPLTTGLTVLDARQEGKAVPLDQENGTQTTVLTGPSEFSITLTVGLPLGIEAGRASFVLPVPSAGGPQLSLVVPGEHTSVNISSGLITNRTSEKGQTTIEATLVPGQSTTVWWATRENAAPVVPREVRFLSNVKTLVSVGEAELRLAALADISVLQGEPAQFDVEVPSGYEVTGVTGASLESSEIQSGKLILKVNAANQRNHQFLVSMERAITETRTTVPFLAFKSSQRETGEVLVEGTGAIELTATESGSLKRMDVKEANAYLRSLAHFPAQAAFRFHTQPNESPGLALEWVRFPDSSVLAAIAENAEITTMITTEGRSLTEVKLTLKNQAQPFLKVGLPTGASILSAEVAGEKVKPVQGPDGNRVPLLRAGFRPTGPYEVSFVFLHSGMPFAKKGGSELSLPSMDVPISLLEWEVFLPEQYKVKDFAGDVIAANLVPVALREGGGVLEIGAGSSVDLRRDAVGMLRTPAEVGSVSETVTVESAEIQALPAAGRNVASSVAISPGVAQNAASANVVNLQRRVAGVLPVAVDVPRAGTSFKFVRPLVLNEETKVTFNYRSK